MGWRERAEGLVERSGSSWASKGAEGALYTLLTASLVATGSAMHAFEGEVAGVERAPATVIERTYGGAREGVGQHVRDAFAQTAEERAADSGAPEVGDVSADLRRERRLVAAEAYLETLEDERDALRERIRGDRYREIRPHDTGQAERRLRELDGRLVEGHELIALADEAELGGDDEVQLDDWLGRWDDDPAEDAPRVGLGIAQVIDPAAARGAGSVPGLGLWPGAAGPAEAEPERASRARVVGSVELSSTAGGGRPSGLTLLSGTAVTVLERANGWARVTTDPIEGAVYERLARAGGDRGQVYAPEAQLVNLRAGRNGPIRAVLRSGMPFRVTGRDGDWLLVDLGAHTGYVPVRQLQD